MHKIDTPAPGLERYQQRLHAPGLASWVYRSSQPRSEEKRWFAGGLELGVVLDGEWQQQSRFMGTSTSSAGAVVRLGAAETYRHQHSAGSRPLRQVGFVLYDDELATLCGEDTELTFAPDAGRHDAELRDFAAWFEAHQAAATPAHVREAVLGYLRRHATQSRPSAVARARRALERDYVYDLPLPVVAEACGLSHLALTRGFKKRYGMTPASYRLKVRLNWASRLLWHRPDWSVERIGVEVGFRQKGYFHRAYLKAFGRAPGASRARVLAAG